MKTTLIIDDQLMAQIKSFAAKQKKTLSATIEALLRKGFQKDLKRAALKPMPSFKTGGFLVDISDRDAVYKAMEKK